MTSKKFARVLVRVTSNNSGGRARIIKTDNPVVKSPIKWSKPKHLTSAIFKGFKVNSYHMILVRVTDSTRSVKTIIKSFPENETMSDIYSEWNELLLKNIDIPWGEKMADHLDQDQDDKPESVENPVSSLTKSDIYIDPNDLKLFNSVRSLSDTMHPAVLMVGPSGYGKTSVPERLAQDWDMKFVRWDCSTIRDPEEFFGYRAAVDGSTANADGKQFFFETEFTQAVQEGNAIIVLDELNRIDPYISNALFPLLDHAGETVVLGHKIKVAKNVIFFATINVGHQFTGTFTLDSALSNRFMAKVLVGPLPESVESTLLQTRCLVSKVDADRIVSVVSKLREQNRKEALDVDVSTRVSIQIANLMRGGLDIRAALTYTVINGVSQEESKVIADAVGIV